MEITVLDTPPPQRVAIELDPTFIAAGYLQEYMGAPALMTEPPDTDAVERFFPPERQIAAAFADVLRGVCARADAVDDVVVDQDAAGFTAVRSRAAALALRAVFRMGATADDGQHGVHWAMFPPRFGWRWTQPIDGPRLSYLWGVYSRYRSAPRGIRLANATHKARIVLRLLQEAGASSTTWRYGARGAPIINTLEFEGADLDWFLDEGPHRARWPLPPMDPQR